MNKIAHKRPKLTSVAQNRRRRKPVPEGEPRWAAWSADLAEIVAYGSTPDEAREAARAKGVIDPALEPVQSRYRQA